MGLRVMSRITKWSYTRYARSFTNKGPKSERGCSINKTLKKYHRRRATMGLGLDKSKEEKKLWRALRLKRNDRGEIVLFCA